MGPEAVRKTFPGLLGLCLLAFALAAAAQAARNVDELMHKSGLWNQVGSLSANLREDMAQRRAQSPKGGPGDMDDATYERLVKATERAFSADRLRSFIATALAKNLTVADEKEVIAWLDSPIGKRMTALEEARDAGPDPMGRYKDAARYLASAPKERVELAERFGVAMQAGDAEVDQLMSLMSAAVYGMSLVDPRIDESAVRQLNAAMEKQRPELVKAMRQLSIALFAWTYKDAPIADVTRYAEFIDSPAGLRYHDATRVALKEAIARAAIDLGRELGENLRRDPKKS